MLNDILKLPKDLQQFTRRWVHGAFATGWYTNRDAFTQSNPIWDVEMFVLLKMKTNHMSSNDDRK